MELIYFWVDGYKNLYDCGINLSPDYIIKKQYSLSNNNLSIDIKENSNNFNPFKKEEKGKAELNITTIVGANGSGKTNLLDALSIILKNEMDYTFKYCLFFKDKEIISYLSSSEFKFEKYKKEEDITIFSDRIVKFKPFNGKKSFSDFSYKKILASKEKDFFYYNEFDQDETAYTISIFLKKINSCKIFDKNNYPDLKFDKFRWELNLEKKYEEFKYKFESAWGFAKIWEETPTKTFLNNYKNKINELYKLLNHNMSVPYRYQQKTTNEKLKDILYFAAASEYIECLNKIMSEKIYGPASENYVNNCLTSLTISQNMSHEKIIIQFRDSLVPPYKQRLSKKYPIYNETKEYLSKVVKLLEQNDLLDYFLTNFSGKSNSKDHNILIYNNEFLMDNYDSNKFSNYYTAEKFLPNKLLDELVIINFYKQGKNKIHNALYSFNELSTGEQRILKFFSDLYYIEEATNSRQAKSIYLFDEMDLSWHPEWQRKMIYYLVDILTNINPRTFKNIIITTHSPFILSDIPKENVTLIEKDKETGNAKIKKPDINTFGANIHNLFEESFFLTSTIGEFAKMEINSIIKDISSVDSYEAFNKIEGRSNIIGEPIIKSRLLKKLYDDKFATYGSKNIDKNYNNLKFENERLKQRILDLEKNKDPNKQ